MATRCSQQTRDCCEPGRQFKFELMCRAAHAVASSCRSFLWRTPTSKTVDTWIYMQESRATAACHVNAIAAQQVALQHVARQSRFLAYLYLLVEISKSQMAAKHSIRYRPLFLLHYQLFWNTWLLQQTCRKCFWLKCASLHYNDVIMGAIASEITSLTVVYSTVYSGTLHIFTPPK